jgi:hypothetical protein
MRYVVGDPWDPKEKQARKAANRPCLTLDELGQYINSLVNDVRQNKRAIQVNPKGSGATDQTAELRGNIIRGIEYSSNAQSAYTTGFENAAQRSYGYWRINTKYVSDKSFDQEIIIERVPNPDTIWLDPDAKEADYSDGKDAFCIDLIPKSEFEKRWPDAKVTDFSTDIMDSAPGWIHEDDIQVAEYWHVEKKPRKLFLMKTDAGPVEMWEDELPENYDKKLILKDRQSHKRIVTQKWTNGVEVLETNGWAGRYIPLIACMGKELWVDEGSGSKRVLMSLIRLARDPQQLYNYYRTCQAELVSMTPKTPWLAIEGQLGNHEEEWQNSNTVPLAVLYYLGKTNGTGDSVLPPPVRQPYEPQIQSLEIGAEGARRAIQAAMGINPLPTAAQRQNEKSGVALEHIESQADQGTYHFIDNYDRALKFTGVVIDDLLGKIMDTSRDVPVRKDDETHAISKINTPNDANSDLGSGEHDVTISTGPSFESEREKADEFVETLIANIQAMQGVLEPAKLSKLLALAITLKDLGPIGKKMSDIIDPTQTEAQMQAALAQAQSQLQQYQTIIAGLQAENQKMTAEKEGKVVQKEYDLRIQALQNDVKVLIAEIGTKAQAETERNEMFLEYWKEQHGAAHEAGMAAQQQSHDKDMAAQQAQNAALSQNSDQQHEQGMAEQAQNQPQGA